MSIPTDGDNVIPVKHARYSGREYDARQTRIAIVLDRRVSEAVGCLSSTGIRSLVPIPVI